MNDNLDSFKEELKKELASDSNSIFEIKPANQFIEIAKNRPIPKMLFGVFWFEGELCILFADTNLGKSILAVQIGNSISYGISTCGLVLECIASLILYIDFELSDKQFENRYSDNFENHHSFSPNFLRAEINPDYLDNNSFKTFEEFLYHSLEKSINDTGIKVLIIDNITFLKDDNEKAKDALPLMKFLKELKNKYGLSILVLAHTPKIDNTRPIENNHLSGSKMLINFCDSCFAIGKSHQEKGLRYIKQIKQRNCEQMYGSDNVIVCKIEKVNSFLQFSFVEFGIETDHLRHITSEDKNERDKTVFELKKQGVSNVQIGYQLGISEGMVRVILKKNNL